jgi:hypothetical protein
MKLVLALKLRDEVEERAPFFFFPRLHRNFPQQQQPPISQKENKRGRLRVYMRL